MNANGNTPPTTWRAEARYVCNGLGTLLGDALADHPDGQSLVGALVRGEHLLRVVVVGEHEVRFEMVDPTGGDPSELVKLTAVKRIRRNAKGDIETIEEFSPLGVTR